jgi:hypothetical protein
MVPLMDILSFFRKVSTKPDQVQFASYVNVFDEPVFSTSYVLLVTLLFVSVALTVNVLVPDGIVAMPSNTLPDDMLADWPWMVIVAASFTVPVTRITPLGCWLVSRLRLL